MTLHNWIVGWMAAALITPAAAAEIYRCGPNGSTYSQTPCADGRRLEVIDARSDEQRLQAKQVNERTVALAASLERDRLAAEAAHRPALAGSFNTPAKDVSSQTARSDTDAHSKAKKERLRQTSQAKSRRAPTARQDAVLAQPQR